MTTLLAVTAAPATAATPTPTVLWASEGALSARRTNLQTGELLRGLLYPPPTSLTSEVLHGLPPALQPRWYLCIDPATDQPVGAPHSIRGQISEILAVTTTYRQARPGHWQPIPGAARARPVPTTCAPEPARSVWIPSGNPVLHGFLITVHQPHLSRRIG